VQPILPTQPIAWSSYFLVTVFFLASFLLILVQWQFSQLTGSVLIFGQGILQLVLTLILILRWVQPARKWQLLAQFFHSFFIILLCGLLISESYIRWQEGITVLTNEALPILLLSFGGLLLLSRLFVHLSDGHFSQLGHRIACFAFPWLSGGLTVVLFITHFTGWFWLDNLVAGITACLLGLVALFFLLDGYWNILEAKV